MRALAVDGMRDRHALEIDAHDRVDGVDERDRVGAAGLGGARRAADVGDVRRQLDDDGHARVLLAPARHHLDVFGHLPDGGAHAALGHAVRTAEIELDAVAIRLLDAIQDRLPGFLIARHHQRSDERAVRPFALDLFDLLQIDLEIAVSDELDIVEGDQAPVGAVDRAIARARYVDDRRTGFAERLPHHPAPAGAKGALDIGLAIGWRRRGEPERIGRLDAKELAAKIDHEVLLEFLLPLAGEGGAQRRIRERPHPNPLPQAGEGVIRRPWLSWPQGPESRNACSRWPPHSCRRRPARPPGG